MAKSSAAAMEQKIKVLRQVTGGKSFIVRNLPGDICSRLDYNSREGFLVFLKTLANGTGYFGRQLIQISRNEYAWVNPSNGGEAEPVKSVSLPYVARDLTSDEAAALDLVQDILIGSQDGPIRLTPKMVAMENDDEEFLNFMEKLESVKASAKIGTNDFSAGGYVWSLVRDKFSDFYQIAQAVRSGQYEFPSEPLPILEPTQSSVEEEQLMALCRATAKELSKSKESVKKLEEELRQAKAKYSEDERRHKVFCSELDKLRHPVK